MNHGKAGMKHITSIAWVAFLLQSMPAMLCAEVVFPGATWTIRTPVDVGMDAAKLDQIAATIGGSGCIVRNG